MYTSWAASHCSHAWSVRPSEPTASAFSGLARALAYGSARSLRISTGYDSSDSLSPCAAEESEVSNAVKASAAVSVCRVSTGKPFLVRIVHEPGV